jgi:hypothetical protein
VLVQLPCVSAKQQVPHVLYFTELGCKALRHVLDMRAVEAFSMFALLALKRGFLQMVLKQLVNACADIQQVLVIRLVQRELCTL